MENMQCILKGYGNGYPEALVGNPTFYWYLTGYQGTQKSYQLRLKNWKNELIWDSGWVVSDQSDNVVYDGPELEWDMDYIAQLSLLDDAGNRYESNPACFSTGLGSLQAKWMRPGYLGGQAPLIRKTFFLKEIPVRARLHVCGLGYQESYLNGQKIGKDVLSPAWTNYKKRVCYNSYDVLPLLRSGENTLGILLGKGWFGLTTGGKEDGPFWADLSIEYADGSKEQIRTQKNDGWMVYSGGPIRSNSLFHGEEYDARCEVAGWCNPGLETKDWDEAILTEPPAGELVPENLESIAPVAVLNPISVTEPENAVYVVDFGQNIAGVVEIEVDEPADATITIRHGEILDKRGMLSTANLRSAKATDVYISAGRKATYRPHFTYHGFRYAEVTGLSKPLQPESIKAIVLRNAVNPAGSFHAENELLNKIQHICWWAENNNLHGIPTDCPQRDERLGWLNDMTVRAEEAVYNFDLHRFYAKFLQDIADEQGKQTGAITDTVPYVNFGSQPADPVSSSYLILGWLLYLHYGDRQILRKHYDGFAAWTDFLDSNTKDGIVNYSYYGDWAAPIAGSIAGSCGAGAVSAITPGKQMSTGFLHYNALLMKQMAEILKKPADIVKWETIAEKTKAALNRVYYHPEGYYAGNSQASNTFMAWLGISPNQEKTVQAIAQSIRENGNHLTTGNLCTRYILEVLAENGQIDLAYDVVTQTTYPSWGYMVENGATTTWERWEYVDSGPMLEMASHCHPMNATVSAWFYRYLLGIQPIKPGFAEFKVAPCIPTKLDGVNGSLPTVKGTIETAWRKTDNETLSLTVSVPFNTRCKVIIPDRWTLLSAPSLRECWLCPGKHELRCRLIYQK